MENKITIIKRDGRNVEFDPEKIYVAIKKAARTVFVIDDAMDGRIATITSKVVRDLFETGAEKVTIEMIQSAVENRLIEDNLITVAQHYIEYRLQRELDRRGHNIVVHLTFEKIEHDE